MFSHIMIGTNDLDRAKKFYDALLAPLGFEVAGRAELADRGKVVRYLIKTFKD